MVPAAVALLWALLLSLGPRAAAGAQGLTSAGTQPVSFRSGSPTTQNDWSTARSSLSPKSTAIVEGEDDIAAAADRVAGPAAAELLASTVSTDVSGSPSWGREDGSLEEGVTTTTVATLPPLSQRLRPTPLHLLGPNPALDFWRRVRIGLEDIWNSLSSVFAQMQPIDRNRR
uniref:Methylated in normal thymocytes n=1 Tax=Rousettus aegyptiacus TaxID=9407 RepID=A0A7J8BCU6_ROUAE|nr:methylated in normal thymocytes [Rousettus aegyptiacus]